MPLIQPGPRKDRAHPPDLPGRGTWDGRARLWVAIDGRNALGPGKIKLLKAIASKKSLAAAAKSLRMSYRLAWKHLRVIEERIGLAVVEPRRGGVQGGGTDLTPQGMALLDAYRAFHDEVDACVQAACRRHFARWSSPRSANTQSKEPPPVDRNHGGGDSVDA